MIETRKCLKSQDTQIVILPKLMAYHCREDIYFIWSIFGKYERCLSDEYTSIDRWPKPVTCRKCNCSNCFPNSNEHNFQTLLLVTKHGDTKIDGLWVCDCQKNHNHTERSSRSRVMILTYNFRRRWGKRAASKCNS